MIQELKQRARKIAKALPGVEKRWHRKGSYSQEGEDRILMRIFGEKPEGFYVDVGAHHPMRFSNTQLFYEHGWRGINIDALPGSMVPFRRRRSRDINLEVGVGAEPGIAKFHVFNEPAVNTFDEEQAAKYILEPSWHIERIIEVPVRPLRDILAEHLPAGQPIDFLTVDVEGRDLEVLRSNDWDRYRPRAVLAESIGKSFVGLEQDPTTAYLAEHGFTLLGKTLNTFIFVDGQAAA